LSGRLSSEQSKWKTDNTRLETLHGPKKLQPIDESKLLQEQCYTRCIAKNTLAFRKQIHIMPQKSSRALLGLVLHNAKQENSRRKLLLSIRIQQLIANSLATPTQATMLGLDPCFVSTTDQPLRYPLIRKHSLFL